MSAEASGAWGDGEGVMLRFRAVLIGVVAVLVAAVSPPAPAAADDVAARTARRRPILAIEISGPFGGVAGIDLSPRGHVTYSESETSALEFQAYRWYQGEAVPLTPDLPAGGMSFASAVNARGDVAVQTYDPQAQPTSQDSVWSDGAMTPVPDGLFVSDIDRAGRLLVNRAEDGRYRTGIVDGDRQIMSPVQPGGETVFGLKMNGHRQVIGYTGEPPFDSSAHVWQPGRAPVALGTLGGAWSWAIDINEVGSVTGFSVRADGEWRPFLWRRNRMIDLGTLGGQNINYPGAGAINVHDQVVGASRTASGEDHAFLWTEGRMRDLGTLGGDYSQAFDINDWGEVVGESTVPSGLKHAFLWRNGVMTDLGALIEDEQSHGEFINNRGQVLGRSMNGELNSVRTVFWETRGRG